MYEKAKTALGKMMEIITNNPVSIRIALGIAFQEVPTLAESDFPAELRKEWCFLRDSLTANIPIDNKGEIVGFEEKNKISLSEIIDRIFKLSKDLERY